MGKEGKVKPARGERAKAVREGLKAGLQNDDIVKLVQEKFPGEPRKRVQTMISRYRLLYGGNYLYV